MKKAGIVFIVLALALGIFNITQIDWDSPFQGNSSIAAIGVIGCACVVVLLLILRSSMKIAEKSNLKS